MREYSNKIALIKNGRGVYSLDPSIGCNSGLKENSKGCYNDCYAAKSSKLYGYDFSKTVLRDFESKNHRNQILHEISKVKLNFIRMGTSGDPSENWGHTFKILEQIKYCNKEIVIITKHWNNMTLAQLKLLETYNVCINTSVSALDNDQLLLNSIEQYNKIKPYCKSILRIVSCDFNLNNVKGLMYSKIQHNLFKNENTLDTILRVNKNNPLVKDGIINVKVHNFMGKKTLASKFNRKTYLGNCNNCLEMCGAKIKVNNSYENKIGIIEQAKLF
jgi:hypothetical protein